MVSKTFLTAIGSLLIAAFLIGCADVPSTGPTPPDPRSLARFVNADPALGNVAVVVDNATVGSVAFQAGTAYGDFPAGSRKVALNPGTAADTARVSFTTDRKATIFILPQSGGVREYFKANERFLYTAPGVANKALVRVINLVAVADTAGDEIGFDVTILGPGTDSTFSALLQKSGAGYWQVDAGNYTLTATVHDDTTVVATSTFTVAGNKRYTSALMGTQAAPAVVNLTDD